MHVCVWGGGGGGGGVWCVCVCVWIIAKPENTGMTIMHTMSIDNQPPIRSWVAIEVQHDYESTRGQSL